MTQKDGMPVSTYISQWGDSAAIRLPAALMKKAGIEKGAAVELSVRGAEIVIRVGKSASRPRYSLPFTQAELIAGMTPADKRADDLLDVVESEWDR